MTATFPKMPCTYCQRINIGGSEHASSEADLDLSANECWLCAEILTTVVSCQAKTSTVAEWPISCSIDRKEGIPILSITDTQNQTFGHVYDACFVTCEGDPAESFGIPVYNSLTNTSSTSSFDIVRGWITKCLVNHDCLQSTPDRTAHRPARMLDVASQSSPPGNVRLVNWDAPGQYVALSYCWGRHDFFVTSTESLELHMQDISWTALPKTFQDAITITRRLGYNYLWIDALCIIQDSVADWEEESQKMANVYSQALVTIAASASESVHGGCFNERSSSMLRFSRHETLSNSNTFEGKVTKLLIYADYPLELTLDQFTKGALSERAWACQERVLSPRILHYTEEQIFWECRSRYESEEGVSPREFKGDSIVTAPGIAKGLVNRHSRLYSILTWYTHLIASLYSTRKLTRLTDRLPALSGLARLFQSCTGLNYVAGMWLEELQYGLFWTVKGPIARSRVNPRPSWSWTAYEEEVTWPFREFSSFPPADFVLQEYKVQLAGQDPLGRVTNASLRILGRICQLRVQARSAHADPSDDESVGSRLELLDSDGKFLTFANIDQHLDAECVYAFFLTCYTTSTEISSRVSDLLLLRKLSDQDDTFERLGTASLFQPEIDGEYPPLPICERRSVVLV